jgi:FAD/FMN-containing dehydrogenase
MSLADNELDHQELHDLGAELAERLHGAVSGELIAPSDREYAPARSIFNAMIDRRPALIARCKSDRDIKLCIAAAEEMDVPISIRSGGHNVAGNAIREGGLVIDCTRLNDVAVDTNSQTAQVQGGATWRVYDAVTQQSGVGTPGGIVSSTGVAGLTLGGGIGVLRGLHGLSCDNLIGATVITATGETVVVSEDEHEDLLWGLRGGGGNFGVVADLTFRVHPVSDVVAGTISFPFAIAEQVIAAYKRVMDDAPKELNCDFALKRAFNGDRLVVIIPTYFGQLASLARILAPLLKLGPVENRLRQTTYCDAQQIHDINFPAGQRHYWKSSFLTGLNESAIDTMLSQFVDCPSPIGVIAVEHFHGDVREIDPDSAAFNHRAAPFNLLIESHWVDSADDDANVQWTRDLWDLMEPHSTGGVYVNYLGNESQERVVRAYGSEKYARLQNLKQRYDPNNLFSSNQNVRPPST